MFKGRNILQVMTICFEDVQGRNFPKTNVSPLGRNFEHFSRFLKEIKTSKISTESIEKSYHKKFILVKIYKINQMPQILTRKQSFFGFFLHPRPQLIPINFVLSRLSSNIKVSKVCEKIILEITTKKNKDFQISSTSLIHNHCRRT